MCRHLLLSICLSQGLYRAQYKNLLPKVDLENTDQRNLKRLLDGPRLAHQLFPYARKPATQPAKSPTHKHRSKSPANSLS